MLFKKYFYSVSPMIVIGFLLCLSIDAFSNECDEFKIACKQGNIEQLSSLLTNNSLLFCEKYDINVVENGSLDIRQNKKFDSDQNATSIKDLSSHVDFVFYFGLHIAFIHQQWKAVLFLLQGSWCTKAFQTSRQFKDVILFKMSDERSLLLHSQKILYPLDEHAACSSQSSSMIRNIICCLIDRYIKFFDIDDIFFLIKKNILQDDIQIIGCIMNHSQYLIECKQQLALFLSFAIKYAKYNMAVSLCHQLIQVVIKNPWDDKAYSLLYDIKKHLKNIPQKVICINKDTMKVEQNALEILRLFLKTMKNIVIPESCKENDSQSVLYFISNVSVLSDQFSMYCQTGDVNNVIASVWEYPGYLYMKNKEGLCAIDIAMQSNQMDVVELLINRDKLMHFYPQASQQIISNMVLFQYVKYMTIMDEREINKEDSLFQSIVAQLYCLYSEHDSPIDFFINLLVLYPIIHEKILMHLLQHDPCHLVSPIIMKKIMFLIKLFHDTLTNDDLPIQDQFICYEQDDQLLEFFKKITNFVCIYNKLKNYSLFYKEICQYIINIENNDFDFQSKRKMLLVTLSAAYKTGDINMIYSILLAHPLLFFYVYEVTPISSTSKMSSPLLGVQLAAQNDQWELVSYLLQKSRTFYGKQHYLKYLHYLNKNFGDDNASLIAKAFFKLMKSNEKYNYVDRLYHIIYVLINFGVDIKNMKLYDVFTNNRAIKLNFYSRLKTHIATGTIDSIDNFSVLPVFHAVMEKAYSIALDMLKNIKTHIPEECFISWLKKVLREKDNSRKTMLMYLCEEAKKNKECKQLLDYLFNIIQHNRTILYADSEPYSILGCLSQYVDIIASYTEKDQYAEHFFIKWIFPENMIDSKCTQQLKNCIDLWISAWKIQNKQLEYQLLCYNLQLLIKLFNCTLTCDEIEFEIKHKNLAFFCIVMKYPALYQKLKIIQTLPCEDRCLYVSNISSNITTKNNDKAVRFFFEIPIKEWHSDVVDIINFHHFSNEKKSNIQSFNRFFCQHLKIDLCL
ncbi:MAG: hypothetical protein HAW62_05320 [Endozoicomonadaceae bacterium]|nr:hypothetical protein [Endozoicomonadaceae bacterium]